MYNFFFVLMLFTFQHSQAKKYLSSNLYTEVLPKVFCQDGEYFITCFEGAKKTCAQDIKNLSVECLDKVQNELKELRKKMPNDRYSVAENTRVGFCIGAEYEKMHADTKKGDLKCYQQKGW